MAPLTLTPPEPAEDCLWAEKTDTGLRVLVRQGEKSKMLEAPLPLPVEQGGETPEFALASLTYDLLRQWTGIRPPWGKMTGVRPVRLIHDKRAAGWSAEQIDRFFLQRFDCSEQKYAMAKEIADLQEPILQLGSAPKTYSLYIGIPFCPSRCSYCSFVSCNLDRDHEWNFTGGLTYGINDKWAAQYQYTGLSTDHTGGNMNELNALYSINPEVAAFGGWNRIHMSDFPDRVFGSSDRTNNVAQLGLIARHPLTDGLDVYAKGALGTEQTTMWEAGVDLAIDEDLDLNAGYHYLNTKGNDDNNVSYKGFMAGVSYRFGGSNEYGTGTNGMIDDSAYARANQEERVSTVSTVQKSETPAAVVTTTNNAGAETTVQVPADTPVAAPENDYYFNSVLFNEDSSDIIPAQKINLDAFVKEAKETGHVFKLVGRTDATGSADYNENLASRRIKAVRDYAVSKGVDASKLVEMVKGSEGSTGKNEGDRRVDIFEHK